MTSNFYIDESGNTGDVLNSGDNYDFAGQPIFSLACIGIDDTSDLERLISYLKEKYRIQSAELKSTKIYRDKPGLITEIVRYIGDKNIPVFIEVVDKKYYICANLVNSHVMPAYSSPPETQESRLARNHCADYFYENATKSVFDRFMDSCRYPSDESLMESFEELKLFMRNCNSNSALSNFIVQNIEESLNDYKEAKEHGNSEAYKKFIPVPDNSKKNKSIWMLPNVSSFASIYARMNLYLNGKLTTARIFHDEQAHFDEIIAHNKELMESLDMSGAISIQTANYNIHESSSLIFAKSHDNSAIQVADLLAGLAMRYVQERIGGCKTSQESVEAYTGILRISNPYRGLGINLVTTSKHHYAIHY